MKPSSLISGFSKARLLKRHKKYLDTTTWQGKREFVLSRDNYTCVICHTYGGKLHVHHKTYKRHGNESLTDLITVCERCHKDLHNE